MNSTPRYSEDGFSIYSVVVGPLSNNVYVLHDQDSGESVLIDAADEHRLLLDICRELGVTRVLETHGHSDHIQAVAPLRDAGYPVYVGEEDAAMLPGFDKVLEDGQAIPIGTHRLIAIHTPGHTPGSFSFAVDGLPYLFSGDTLFPGGPGATSFAGGSFPTIIESISNKLFTLDPETVVLPGHGSATTIGAEVPHLEEWVERGW